MAFSDMTQLENGMELFSARRRIFSPSNDQLSKYFKIVSVHEFAAGRKHHSRFRKSPRNSEVAQEHTTEMNIAGTGYVIKKSQSKNVTSFSFIT